MESTSETRRHPEDKKVPSLSYDRLSVVVGLALLGMAFSFLVQLPSQTFASTLFGQPWEITIPGDWIMNAILVGLVCTGTDSIIRRHPAMQHMRIGYTLTFWILPATLTLSAISFLHLSPDRLYWLAGLAFSGLLLAWVIMGQYHTVDPDDPHYGAARLSLNIISYLAALGVFISIYGTKTRSLFSATAIAVTGVLLSLELLRGAQKDANRTWLYALSIGLVMGELTWPLNYWGIGGAVGGVFLLLVFYALTGICQSYLQGRLSKLLIAEFAIVGIIGLALLSRYSPWIW